MRGHLLLSCVFLVMSPLTADAVVINEVMADPGGIDWNNDLTQVAAGDEFVELVNPATTAVDISGWRISDTVQVRHVFAAQTFVPAGGSIVVFGSAPGGGIPGPAVGASAATLGLNNTSDQVTLDDGALVVDTMAYGLALDGISWNRDPDGDSAQPGAFNPHNTLPDAVGGGSPGRRANGSVFSTGEVPLPFINEWLPNPDTAVNDWNLDGLGDDAHDEFVEIVNPADGLPRDIGGWVLEDAVAVRHVFDSGTVLPAGASIVVIASGTPVAIPGLAVEASTGQLGLNNSGGEVIQLLYGDLVASSVSYLQQTSDVSWNRSPDADPDATIFVLHTAASNGAFMSSPGLRADRTPFEVPEPDGAAIIAVAALVSLTAKPRADESSSGWRKTAATSVCRSTAQ